VTSDVCPMFFGLGQRGALARLCAGAGLQVIVERRTADTLEYANADDACDAAFAGGPVALAWSRFDANVRVRVRARYVKAIEPWRVAHGYRIPAEFVVVSAASPQLGESPWRSGNLPAADTALHNAVANLSGALGDDRPETRRARQLAGSAPTTATTPHSA